jgi:hypothetical protein
VTNRKLNTAQAYYRMANRMRARGNEIERAGWEEERSKYDTYIATLMTHHGAVCPIDYGVETLAASESCNT